MKIGKCGCCGKSIRYEMVEVVEGYPKIPHGFCYNPECESYGWATDCIETSPNDLDEDEVMEYGL